MHRTTVLSQKGQVVLPKELRDAQRWQPGTRLHVQAAHDGILLTAALPQKTGNVHAIAARAGYHGPAHSIEDMNDAIRKGVAARHARR